MRNTAPFDKERFLEDIRHTLSLVTGLPRFDRDAAYEKVLAHADGKVLVTHEISLLELRDLLGSSNTHLRHFGRYRLSVIVKAVVLRFHSELDLRSVEIFSWKPAFLGVVRSALNEPKRSSVRIRVLTDDEKRRFQEAEIIVACLISERSEISFQDLLLSN